MPIPKLKPVKTPYSSIVGGGIALKDENGAYRFNIMVCGFTNGISKEEDAAICAKIIKAWET